MKKIGIAISVTFLVLVGGISALGFLVKDREFSENENRYLASAPGFTIADFMSGDFQENLESYLNDQIWLRDGWITIKTAVQKACGDTDIGGAYVGRDGYDFEKILPEDVDDALVERNIQAVSDYFAYCTKTLEPSRVSFLLVPTSGLVLKDKLPKNAILFDQQAYLDRVRTAMDKYNFISPEDILVEHSDEEVYYHTDHHWTTRGAFLTYSLWCDATGHVFAGEEAYQSIQMSDSFRGSLYSKILDYDSVYDTIEIMKPLDEDTDFKYSVTADGEELDGVYQDEFLSKKDKYAYFFGGNYKEVHIEVQRPSNMEKRNLLVIKDSFANSFVPFIISEYDNIYMVDLRYNNDNMGSYLEEHEITDVLVLYNVSNFISDKNIFKLSRGL